MPDDVPPGPDGGVGVVRRAPFSDNPRVGARGQRTQQRILDAALRAFGEAGYHGCSIERIAKLARCSRVSFYQYFESKEDVFRQLAGQVARQVSASTEALEPLTAGSDGWGALRAWVARYAEIYVRYEPIFNALEIDEVLSRVAQQTGGETVARIHSRLATTTLPPRQLDPAIRLLLECTNHTFEVAGILRAAAPDDYPADRIEDAITDVLHRTLFGMRPDVNVHGDGAPAPRPLEPSASMLELLAQDAGAGESGNGNRAFVSLLTSGRDVFVERGFHQTRVDDLVDAAGVSHGAFYRYFKNKNQMARVLAARAARAVGVTVTEIPEPSELVGPSGRGALRRWLRHYHAAQRHEAAMLRVWIDAALQNPVLRRESAPLHDWGRRRMARWLHPRGFGDVEMDAVVMVALLGAFGARERPPVEIEAAARVVERGLLGR